MRHITNDVRGCRVDCAGKCDRFQTDWRTSHRVIKTTGSHSRPCRARDLLRIVLNHRDVIGIWRSWKMRQQNVYPRAAIHHHNEQADELDAGNGHYALLVSGWLFVRAKELD